MMNFGYAGQQVGAPAVAGGVLEALRIAPDEYPAFRRWCLLADRACRAELLLERPEGVR